MNKHTDYFRRGGSVIPRCILDDFIRSLQSLSDDVEYTFKTYDMNMVEYMNSTKKYSGKYLKDPKNISALVASFIHQYAIFSPGNNIPILAFSPTGVRVRIHTILTLH